MSVITNFRLIFVLLILLLITGCGSGGNSETNGQLSLVATTSDLTGGLYELNASAVYTNPDFPDVTGIEISISTSAHTLSGAPVTQDSGPGNADSSGSVTLHQTYVQTSETIYVDVTARTGGLVQTKTVVVPPL